MWSVYPGCRYFISCQMSSISRWHWYWVCWGGGGTSFKYPQQISLLLLLIYLKSFFFFLFASNQSITCLPCSRVSTPQLRKLSEPPTHDWCVHSLAIEILTAVATRPRSAESVEGEKVFCSARREASPLAGAEVLRNSLFSLVIDHPRCSIEKGAWKK